MSEDWQSFMLEVEPIGSRKSIARDENYAQRKGAIENQKRLLLDHGYYHDPGERVYEMSEGETLFMQKKYRALMSKKERKRAKAEIRATVDLHGMTLEEAEKALNKWLCYRENGLLRVITGKGKRSEGKLKAALPQWLDKIEQVVWYSEAPLFDGGAGAYYVKLKK